MSARNNESEIDRLYQLPLDEFTVARNALARQVGPNAASIRQLAKPPLAAWSINQLYWRNRDTYEALVAASEQLRRTHKTVLGGRAGDLRAAGRVHDQALDRALKATMAIVADAGHPASDATRQAIVSTLRALPSGEAPGRLSATLQPGGFEMLAGLPIAAGGSKARVQGKGRAAAPQSPRREEQPATKDARAEARAKKEAAAAAEALRKAEQVARREEFERARLVREAERTQREVERAREALARAREDLEAAERAAKAADTARDRAERSAREAQEALTRLRPV